MRVAKLYAYWITVNYREAYGMHASQRHPVQPREPAARRDIRHPQDHPRGRGHRARAAGKLYLGNLDAKRDWGHAREYVRGMWLMLQQDEPDDYVLATGETTEVREFVEWAFEDAGVPIEFEGEGVDEKGYRQEPTDDAWSRSIRAISARPRSIC